MKPELPPIESLTMTDYDGVERTFKMFTPKSLEINHPNANLINSFALRFCGDKTNGTYIEVGASDWIEGNNTYLLEKEFGWKGVGIEIQEHYVDNYNKNRTNPCIQADATKFNWDKYLEANNFPTQIDHLSIDTDQTNLFSLLNIPLSRYRFSTIVIENTDMLPNLSKDHKVKNIQQEVLSRHSYTLIGSSFTNDFWIDNKYLKLAGSQWNDLSQAFWYGDIKS